MQNLSKLTSLPLLFSVVWLLGCGGGADNDGGSSGAAPGGVRTVPLEKLPDLGEPFPQPLDEGRVTIAPPEGWEISPRDSNWMIRFQKDMQDAYPTIIVYAEPDSTGMNTITAQNAEEFAQRVAAELSRGATAQKTVLEPMTVGSFVGVNYERRGKAKHGFKTIVVERAIMETIVGGRRYKIDLRTRDGDLHQYRPHVLAVAGGMKFHSPGSAVPPSEPAGSPAEPDLEAEPSAETPAAAETPAEKPAAAEPEVEFEEEL